MRNGVSTLAEQLAGAQFDLYAYISVLMGGAAEAADVLQETNLAILQDASSYDPSRNFVFWARGFARNRVRRFYRSRSRDRLVFDEELMNSLSETVSCVSDDRPLEELVLLRQCMESLAPKQRELITARYFQATAVKDIAAREACSEGAVSVLLHRVRRLIAECIEKKRKQAGALA
ncbi:MAG: sigma-70 family RNA polymerase sigma factor [Lentisphaerae bacterium]|jgi:RNA polymerase sigma-70 factor (ECF subfamily)|nr:sigma-70 family RNA polymerase sigma factor [Lentisphaerota bacterium]